MTSSSTAETKLQILKDSSFGSRVAEDEAESLDSYFVKTDQWGKILSGSVDVVYGVKGSGKSAIYTLIVKSADALRARKIALVSAENPRGATVFHNLSSEPPASEREFIELWKIYIVCLCSKHIVEAGFSNPDAKLLLRKLADAGLVHQGGLAGILRAVRRFVAVRFARLPKTTTRGVEINPTSGVFTPQITHQYEDAAEDEVEELTDDLLTLVDKAFKAQGEKLWILFDRLDVAFLESRDLEANAIRALFRTYSDLRAYDSISLKLFVRLDIWKRITERGFAEESHITRSITISWNSASLLNLTVLRLIRNPSICAFYGQSPGEILSGFDERQKFFYRVFPQKVDSGTNKSDTFDWILGRTRDGTQLNTPRELIHFLGELRDEQIKRLERAESVPQNGMLFDRSVFKQALLPVSIARLHQTLYAEYPETKTHIEALRIEKTLQSLESLALLWGTSVDSARDIASKLVAIGLFEQRGSKEQPMYWVPFLYRDALEMVQGTADSKLGVHATAADAE